MRVPRLASALAGMLAGALGGCSSVPTPDQPAGGAPVDGASAGAPTPPRADSMSPAQPSGTRIASASTSGFTTPEQLVLRDQAVWQAAWSRLHEGMVAPPLPAVDFAREMVVLLALGERSSGGHRIRFDGITVAGANATVRFTITEPGADCMTTQVMTAPVDVVRVPRAAGTVRFEPTTVRSSC
jgi:hypothetical protein